MDINIIPKFLDAALTPVAKEIGERLSDIVSLAFTPVIKLRAVRDMNLSLFLEDLNNKEKWWIRYFRKSNMICINIDDGGKGAEAHTRFKLRKSHKIISQTDEHKSKFREYCMSKCPSHQIDDKYYEKNPVRRQDFLRRCRNKGLNFDDYIEAHVATKSFGKHIKLYKYYHKDKTCPIVHRDYESEELLKQYAMNPTPRSTFKTSCKHRGWNFDDFDEIFAGWYYFPNNDNHRAKRYFYIKRIED